ncbi:hypothetical protein HZA45_02235 [Candidatus Peregrinibacteria bacterium]|nr:hypothetical protein [Candidatus Peregrinibacteria bacterium]
MHHSDAQKRHETLIHSDYSVQPDAVRFFDLGIYEVLEQFSLQLKQMNNETDNKRDHVAFRCDSLGDIFTVHVPKSIEQCTCNNLGKTVRVTVPRSVQDCVHAACVALLLRIDRMYTELENTPEDVRSACRGKKEVWEALNRCLRKRPSGSEKKEDPNKPNAGGVLYDVTMSQADAFVEVQWDMPATKNGHIELLDPNVGNILVQAGLKKGDSFTCTLQTTHGQSTGISNVKRAK